MWKALAILMISVFLAVGCEPNPNEPLVEPEDQIGVPDQNVPQTPSEEAGEETADELDDATDDTPGTDVTPGTTP